MKSRAHFATKSRVHFRKKHVALSKIMILTRTIILTRTDSKALSIVIHEVYVLDANEDLLLRRKVYSLY